MCVLEKGKICLRVHSFSKLKLAFYDVNTRTEVPVSNAIQKLY